MRIRVRWFDSIRHLRMSLRVRPYSSETERDFPKVEAAGSYPATGTNALLAQSGSEHSAYIRGVRGSNP